MTWPDPGRHQLLIRRNRATGELAYYRCFSPRLVPLTELVNRADRLGADPAGCGPPTALSWTA
ncbi:hypothetical protein ACWCQZ_48670 [Streptomyces sp. NPDC002285]